MSIFRKAVFSTTVANLNDLPTDSVCEVAFAGRSNAGKSSAINTLAGRVRLAYVSKTPGRTQQLVYFDMPPLADIYLVDLPGYGYAAVSRSDKERWQRVMLNYLMERESLTAVVLLCALIVFFPILVAAVVGLSRQNMRKLMLGHHQQFPAPVHSGNPSVWHLAQVLEFLQKRQYRQSVLVFLRARQKRTKPLKSL